MVAFAVLSSASTNEPFVTEFLETHRDIGTLVSRPLRV